MEEWRRLSCRVEVPYSAGMVGPWHVLQVGFSRHFAQLKPFYADAAAAPSELRCPILGLNLILLLINNRLDEFHCEVRRASPQLTPRTGLFACAHPSSRMHPIAMPHVGAPVHVGLTVEPRTTDDHDL